MKIFLFLSLLIILPYTAYANAANISIEVFTDSNHPINVTSDVIYYKLDSFSKLLFSLNRDLKYSSNKETDIEQAKKIFLSYKPFLKKASKSIFLAKQYNLTEYPAFVFNKEAVFYGSTSLQDAKLAYKLWKAKLQKEKQENNQNRDREVSA
jgi:integrating conjugative element protein (TIGR03757 family)